jgi:tetratricopeptide (TPR) repeat protein
LKPDEESYYVNRASAYFFDLKDYDRAMADLDIALKLNPNDAYCYSLRADLWDQKQDYKRAIADSNAAIKLNPKEPTNYQRRSRDESKLALWGLFR